MIPAVSEPHVAPVSYARLRAGSGEPAQAWRPAPLRDILPKRIWHNVVERFRMNATNVQMGDWLGQRAAGAGDRDGGASHRRREARAYGHQTADFAWPAALGD